MQCRVNRIQAKVKIYEARVHWCRAWRTIMVHEIPDQPTVGMEMLRGHRIEFDAVADVEPLELVK